jgi:hypothetical protein
MTPIIFIAEAREITDAKAGLSGLYLAVSALAF